MYFCKNRTKKRCVSTKYPLNVLHNVTRYQHARVCQRMRSCGMYMCVHVYVYSAISVIIKKPEPRYFWKNVINYAYLIYMPLTVLECVFSDTFIMLSCTFELFTAKNCVTSNILSLGVFCGINFSTSTASNVDSIFCPIPTDADRTPTKH